MFKVGDRVVNARFGEGSVIEIIPDKIHPVIVEFDADFIVAFSYEGSYVDGEDRPEEDIRLIERKPLEKTIADRLALASTWSTEIPDFVTRRLFGDTRAQISYAGTEVSFGDADYASLEEMREAIGWLVEQFNGEVKWTS